MYKITFSLKSAVCFIDRPMLDGILSYCVAKDMFGAMQGNLTLTDDQVRTIHDAMPLNRHADGWFLASWMLWNEDESIEFTGSWKKRWNEKHDHLADFAKKKRKVRITAGEFKSYSMPLTLHQIKEVWFYFDSPDPDRVRDLLSRHVFGLGKKTSQGWGEIAGFEIEAVADIDFAGLRPIPVIDPEQLKQAPVNLRYMAYRPPYWLPANFGWCRV